MTPVVWDARRRGESTRLSDARAPEAFGVRAGTSPTSSGHAALRNGSIEQEGWMSGPGDVIRAAVERLNANDLAGYYALMADGIVMTTASRTLTGKPAVTAELDENFPALSNHRITVDRLVVSGQHVATWLSLGGETVRSGMPWHVEGCTVWEVCDGYITSIREYYDWSPLLQALGIVADA
jgi:ketosteroid isomerase-like protein